MVFIYRFNCKCTVCTHCCVVHCMYVDFPPHMYMHTHSQCTNITSRIHIYLVCQHAGPVVFLLPLSFFLLISHLSKVLGMFLCSKSSLLNGNILHLIVSLVGTLDSEHECFEIPYPQAFKDLLVGEMERRDSVKQAGECYQIPPYQNHNLVPI